MVKKFKTIDWGNNGGLAVVDENGNLYSPIIGKKGEEFHFHLPLLNHRCYPNLIVLTFLPFAETT